MRAGPPKIIEAAIALLVPPASREHVLGDLHERYAGTGNYLADAFSAVPGAIAGRVFRVADWQRLVFEACLLYVSFLSAAWAAFGAPYVWHADFLRLMAPAALALLALVSAEVYGIPRRFLPAMAACLGAVCALLLGAAAGQFSAWRWIFGGALQGALGVTLVSAARIWFVRSGGNRPCGRVR